MSASAPSGSRAPRSLNEFSDDDIRRIYFDWRFWAREDQLPPGEAVDWRVWLLLGGRGAGKTRAGAEWVRAMALGLWDGTRAPRRRIALVGETHADVRRVMIEGSSGLLSVHPDGERPVYETTNGRLVWPNGSVAHVFSAESPDSLRGPQFEFAWCDAFLGAMLEGAGIRSTRSLRARSYLAWGEALETARLGAIAVLSRGSNPALGHVGFVVGETKDEIVLLGGNQSNAVTVAAFDRRRLLALRWPPAAASHVDIVAAGSNPVPVEAVFEVALAHVLRMEGGYSDDPYDPGGPTNFGITLRTYAAHMGRTLDAASHTALKSELRSIRPEVVRAIYQQRYWRPAQCDELSPGLALFHFDAAVNHGVGTAIRSLQEALGVDADGEIGPITRRALREAAVPDVIARYAMIRERRYRALKHFWRFGRGWLNRVSATKAAALRQDAGAPASAVPLPQPATDGEVAMTKTTEPAATKWWGHSMTVWGALVTAAAAILPAFGPLLGLEITSEFVRQVGADIGAIVQAVAGVVGTLMTLYGRARATAPLMRREMNVRL